MLRERASGDDTARGESRSLESSDDSLSMWGGARVSGSDELCVCTRADV